VACVKNNDEESRLAWLAEGNVKQARKRVSAKAVIRDQDGRILLVNPTYKEHWDLPGGMAEANEPPSAALVREIAEELTVNVTAGRLLALDWVGPYGPWDDQLIFVFDGGALASHVIDNMKIADSELSDFKFFPLPDAKRLLRDDVATRLERAVSSLRTDATHYGEDQGAAYED
jgi:8-oxo-dGTP pyrophosphatase MutT (NUDIX family)